MAAHTYWRLNVSANCGDSTYLQIAEIELRASVGGADECSGGTATASTSYSGSFTADKAYDNSSATSWATSTNNTTGWIAYQFASPVDILEYTIQVLSGDLTRAPKDFALEWSDDGVTWISADWRLNVTPWTSSETKTFTVPVVTGNYWRINVSQNNGDSEYLQIAEIEMRATAGGADECNSGLPLASSFLPGYAPPVAFANDGSTTSWATQRYALSGWIGYKFPTTVTVAQYTIQSLSSLPNRAPKAWTLESSSDGITWTPVETRENQTGWTANQIRTFTVPTTPTDVRVSQATAEVLRSSLVSDLRASQVVAEVLRTDLGASLRASQLVVEVLRPNAPAAGSRPLVFVCC
jgi:F5/8 type C domain